MRMLHFLSTTRAFHWELIDGTWKSRCHPVDLLPFFWTYVVLDLDLECWHVRFPFVPVCTYLIQWNLALTRAVCCDTLCDSSAEALATAFRLTMVETYVVPVVPVGPVLGTTWDGSPYPSLTTMRALHDRHRRASWLATCCMTVRGLGFASELVSHFYVGDWLLLLELVDVTVNGIVDLT